MKILSGVLAASLIVGGCASLNKKAGLADDNMIEEAVENKIKDITGLDVDLTPESPESHKEN